MLLAAGFGFFFAVGVQGITPWLRGKTRTPMVEAIVTTMPIWVADETS